MSGGPRGPHLAKTFVLDTLELGSSYEEILEHPSGELGPRCTYLTQVPMHESLGYGVFMENRA